MVYLTDPLCGSSLLNLHEYIYLKLKATKGNGDVVWVAN